MDGYKLIIVKIMLHRLYVNITFQHPVTTVILQLKKQLFFFFYKK